MARNKLLYFLHRKHIFSQLIGVEFNYYSSAGIFADYISLNSRRNNLLEASKQGVWAFAFEAVLQILGKIFNQLLCKLVGLDTAGEFFFSR